MKEEKRAWVLLILSGVIHWFLQVLTRQGCSSYRAKPWLILQGIEKAHGGDGGGGGVEEGSMLKDTVPEKKETSTSI